MGDAEQQQTGPLTSHRDGRGRSELAFERGWYWAGACFCALMFGVHIVAARNIVGIPDFWRDMYWATSIAHGERLPLSGPPIYHLIELGPWWYYLLALPILVTHSITAAAIFGQCLAATKYVLAWRIGMRALDARFGLAFCVSLALAGWSTAALVFPSHTALVETSVLLLAVATWRCRERIALSNIGVFGLACAACIHAHPSTAPYIVLASAVLLYWHRSPTTLLWLCVAAAIVLLSLAPPLFDQTALDEPGFGPRKSLAAYAEHDLGVNFGKRLPQLLAGLAFGGTWTGLLLMTPWSLPAIRLAFAVHCACLMFALCGLFVLRRKRPHLLRWAGYALLGLLVQCVFLLGIRSGTPIWMTQSCLVPLAFAIALGWYGWFDSQKRGWRLAAMVLFATYAALDLAPFLRYVQHARYNRIMPDSNPLADISAGGATFEERQTSFYSVAELDRLGPNLCAPMVLHARLAAVVEQALAAPVRNACGFWPALHYAGSVPGARHVAGISARAVAAIGLVPDRLVAGIAWYDRVQPVAPPQGLALTHLERMRVMPDAVYVGFGPHTYDFDADPAAVVVLTNRFPIVAPLEIRQITANGQAARKVFDEGDSFFYVRGGGAADSVHWHIELNAIEEDIDVVAIASAQPQPAAR
jgi:hypothetical protein